MKTDTSNHCHVCGFDHGEPPWGISGRDPAFSICDCCGCEYGNDDATEQAIVRFRGAWRDASHEWFNPKRRSAGWNAESQMQGIPVLFPQGIARMDNEGSGEESDEQ